MFVLLCFSIALVHFLFILVFHFWNENENIICGPTTKSLLSVSEETLNLDFQAVLELLNFGNF